MDKRLSDLYMSFQDNTLLQMHLHWLMNMTIHPEQNEIIRLTSILLLNCLICKSCKICLIPFADNISASTNTRAMTTTINYHLANSYNHQYQRNKIK